MNQSIGILDSGLGGLTVFLACTKAYPKAPFVFLADQKHAPYGSKSKMEILAITDNNIQWFISQGITDILLACNTASSVALPVLASKYPQLNLIGIIDATVDALPPVSKVAVLATHATVATKAYTHAIKRINKNIDVMEIDGVNLAALIETLADDQQIIEQLKKILPTQTKVDALVLGCTHYPIISHLIKQVWDVPLVDSLDAIVAMINPLAIHRHGPSHLFTTKNADYLSHQIKQLFNKSYLVKQVRTPHEL